MVPSVTLDWRPSNGANLTTTVSGVFGPRNSVQFEGFADRADNPDAAGNYGARVVDIDNFRSLTLESRLVLPWQMRSLGQSLATGVAFANNRMRRRQQGTAANPYGFDLTVSGEFRRDMFYRTVNAAAYVENLFRLTPAWTVVPGARVEVGRTRMTGRLAYYDPADTPTEITHKYPLLGIRSSYNFASGVEAYGGWSQAYRPQILKDVIPANALERTDPDLKDSRGWTVEAGLRGTLAGRLAYDVGVFQMRIGDRFGTVLQTDPADGSSYLFRTNVGTSRTRGIETSLEAWLIQRPSFTIWAHTSTSYYQGRYLAGTASSGGRNVDITGNTVESIPQWISRNSLSLESGRVSLSMLVSHTSSSFADALNTVTPSANGAVGLVPSHTVVDLNGSVGVTSWLRLRAGVNNLFDLQYFTKRPQFYPGPGVWPSDGRTFQVTAEVRHWPGS
jgi:Fe(3+) dicitrate transport protein